MKVEFYELTRDASDASCARRQWCLAQARELAGNADAQVVLLLAEALLGYVEGRVAPYSRPPTEPSAPIEDSPLAKRLEELRERPPTKRKAPKTAAA